MLKRLKEIDALRGVAIITMAIFHAGVMVYLFELGPINLFSGPWHWLARFTQYLFLGLVGVSITLSKRDVLGQTGRAVKIFAAGILVSIATAVVFGADFVRFGILHFIAVAVVLTSLFKGRPALAVIGIVVVILLGESFDGTILDSLLASPWDYFAPFPWLAVPLLGVVIGELFYKERKPTVLAFVGEMRILGFLGRHSLLIYLLHFPLLYSIFWLISQSKT